MNSNITLTGLFILVVLIAGMAKSNQYDIAYLDHQQQLDSCDIKTYVLVKEAVEMELHQFPFKKLSNHDNKMWIGFIPDSNLVFKNIQIFDQLKDTVFNKGVKGRILQEYDSCTVFKVDEYETPKIFVVPIKIKNGKVTFM